MSNLRFSSQSACGKFYAKLDAIMTDYVDGVLTPDETYEILRGLDYGKIKAIQLIESWRIKYDVNFEALTQRKWNEK